MSDSEDSAVLVNSSSLLSEPDLIPEGTRTERLAAVTNKNDQKDKSGDLEMTEVQSSPCALQIVSIGSEQDKYAFRYDKLKLQAILAKIPAEAQVAVISVVGAFRTGKSFLLSWFLRYLDHVSSSPTHVADPDWYSSFQTVGNTGFDWKAGAERNTTGIWMWSEPFIMKSASTSGNDKAVLLIDTQGMFDNETTMSLTASIFGFSTLLSSYQIYNVDKRIQEDNLQQLALFSEYARMAVNTDEQQKTKASTESVADTDADNAKETTTSSDEAVAAATTTTTSSSKPFQRIEFLVRDWQNFGDNEDAENYEAMEQSMEEYLDKVISERDAKDLRETREQILSCFATISCFGLVHPGSAVTKMKYTGDIQSMEPVFLQLLSRYCARVFDVPALEPKIIHGRALTAAELGVYVEAYAELFASGATFPTAETMLNATAKANNTNALQLSMAEYKESMNRIAGPHCSNYMGQDDLSKEHASCRHLAMAKFNSMATFGSKRDIDVARKELVREIASGFEIYKSLNEGRNPLAGFEV